MPVQFKISVTKEILGISKECGAHDDPEMIKKNCAIAVAVRDIFPGVAVTGQFIYPFGINEYDESNNLAIPLPKVARDFIQVFDSLSKMTKVRLLLPEFDFEISIPDEIIAGINIEEIQEYIQASGNVLRSAGAKSETVCI